MQVWPYHVISITEILAHAAHRAIGRGAGPANRVALVPRGINFDEVRWDSGLKLVVFGRLRDHIDAIRPLRRTTSSGLVPETTNRIPCPGEKK